MYGIWFGNYDGPIIVGFISEWAACYIVYVRLIIEHSIENEANEIVCYTLPLQRYINYPVLVLSLIALINASVCIITSSD